LRMWKKMWVKWAGTSPGIQNGYLPDTSLLCTVLPACS